MATEKHFARGTSVRTTQEDPEVAETYTEEGRKKRRWGVEGKVGSFNGGHSPSYEVEHNDGTKGYYGPSELEVI